jgi:hypothetical protein
MLQQGPLRASGVRYSFNFRNMRSGIDRMISMIQRHHQGV